MARLNRAWVAPALLGLITLALTLWLWRWGTLNHTWGNDEELYRQFARGVARDFPGLIFHLDPTYGRGIQRLHLLLIALPMTHFDNPTAFILAHLLFAGAYASSAIPAWLIARGCGLGRYQALVPAVLVVLVPWAVVTTSFLAEPVGYGAFAWALWAIWRAAARPSLGADALAVALALVALFSRTGFLLLLPLLPTVAVVQAARYGTGEGPPLERLRRLPSAALRRQPLAVGLGLSGVLFLALAWVGVFSGGAAKFTGTYSTSLPPLNQILLKWRTFMSRIDAGTGFVLLAAALPWLVARVARPRDPAVHAFAWTALLAIFCVLFSLVSSPGDERYVMFVAFPVVLAGCVGLMRLELGPLMLLAGGAFALVLWFWPGWAINDPSDFGYFGYPAESFIARVVLVKLKLHPVAGLEPRLAGGLILGGLLLAVAVLALLPRWRRWLPLAIIPAAVFQLAQTDWALGKHVNTVGSAHGPGLHARAFVDQHVPHNEQVGIFAVSNGLTGNYSFAWREIQYWNTTMRSVVKVQSPFTLFATSAVPYPYSTFSIEAALDERSGKLRYQGPYPFPRYLVVPQPPISIALNWHSVARSSYLPAELVKLDGPPQARTTIAGLTPDGFTTPDAPVTMTIYRAGRPAARCAFADLIAPQADVPQPGLRVGYRLLDGRRVIAHGTIDAGGRKRLYMPVRYKAAAPSAQLTLVTQGTIKATGGAQLGVQVGNYDALASGCPRTVA